MISLTQEKREKLIEAANMLTTFGETSITAQVAHVALVSLTAEPIMVSEDFYEAIELIQKGCISSAGRFASIQRYSGVGEERMFKIFTAPPASQFPDKLPCDVSVAPNLVFRKGFSTQTLLNYLIRKTSDSSETVD